MELVEADAKVEEEGAEVLDALVGAYSDAQLRRTRAIVPGLGDKAFPGDGAAGDGENDEAAVAEALAGVTMGGVAVAAEEVGARGAGRQGVVGEVEVLGGNEVEGHPQEAAEGEVGERLFSLTKRETTQ